MIRSPGGEVMSIGRYAIHEQIAVGGMCAVHLGRMRGALGFSLTVAIKRLLPEHAAVRRFIEMLVDEARFAARVRHPNVVPVLDVFVEQGELFVVMEHVLGVTLAELLARTRERGERPPPRAATSIVCGALEGLHAAHEARSEAGDPLGIVHRDVSPQNILVGADGVARVLDFGFARADVARVHASLDSARKGKIGYMAPEQLGANLTSRASDIYAAGVVLAEALTGQRPFRGTTAVEIAEELLLGQITLPSRTVPGLPAALDAVVARATSPVPEARHGTAREMSAAIEAALPGSLAEAASWVGRAAARDLEERAARVRRVEGESLRRVESAVAWLGGPADRPAVEAPASPDPWKTHAAKRPKR